MTRVRGDAQAARVRAGKPLFSRNARPRRRSPSVWPALAKPDNRLYILTMEFEWDESKRQANRAKHGVDFAEAKRMLGNMPAMLEDARRNYGERRCLAVGEEAGRLLVVVFTIRDGVFRIISARKANARERSTYADQIC